ncbi:unnamed protein product [Symbiodinium natans]|uniref:Uncharacterized protein n=1 Tax=Symbiodinium natans TaxID=878477 RepID=A0A812UTK2_9DINO|nr:unnamed protein product [Symbiodinium natans]
MGKPWKANSGNGKWAYWSGSWAAASPKHRGQAPWHSWKSDGNQNTGKEQPFPTYTKMAIAGASGNQDAQASSLGGAGTDDFIKHLQKAINDSRKLTSKLQKLSQDRQMKTSQWDAFQAELRKNFISQKKAFEADMAKIEREYVEAERQRDTAMINIRTLASHGKTIEAKPEPTVTAEEAAAWRDLLTLSQMEEEDVSEAEVARMLQSSTGLSWEEKMQRLVGNLGERSSVGESSARTPQVDASSLHLAGHGFATPDRRTTRVPQMTPAAAKKPGPTEQDLATAAAVSKYVSTSPTVAASDPYQGDAATHLHVGGMTAEPSGLHNPTYGPLGRRSPHSGRKKDLPTGRVTGPPDAPRASVKAASMQFSPTRTAGGIDLAAKLDARRQALDPNGLVSQPSTVTVPAVIDDDISDMEQDGARHASLERME